MPYDDEDTRRYLVVLNDEEQYSVWLADQTVPPGWRREGTEGMLRECLDHIDTVWVDMRPRSVRLLMDRATVPATSDPSMGDG
jgi:MbtH protein